MKSAHLRMQGVSKHFDGVVALREISLELRRGSLTVLLGPNGAGKTTLFDVVCGFVRPDSGSVILNGTEVTARKPEVLAMKGVGRTFHPVRLLRRLTVVDNFRLAATRGARGWPARVGLRSGAMSIHQVREQLENLGISASLDRPAGELSYGQQKLVTLALWFNSGADLLLCDEPFSGVQPWVVERISTMLKNWVALDRTAVIIEHNKVAALSIADRVITLEQGRVVGDEATPR